jgi:hypothetical protein
VTNPYLQPVGPFWARAAGICLLLAGAALTAYLARSLIFLVLNEEARRRATSSTAISALVLLSLCGFCWQAGYRLACGRPARSRMLFSRPGWIAVGTGLLLMAVLMAYAIAISRPPTLIDFQVIIGLASLGVWCFVLAYRNQ